MPLENKRQQIHGSAYLEKSKNESREVRFPTVNWSKTYEKQSCVHSLHKIRFFVRLARNIHPQ